jgi:hypothetical protein
MKTLIKILVAGCLLISTSAFADEILTAYAKQPKNLFVLKAQKKFKGARVEVFEADGDLITSQNLQKRKMVIDFGNRKNGTYVIRVTLGALSQEFRYTSK